MLLTGPSEEGLPQNRYGDLVGTSGFVSWEAEFGSLALSSKIWVGVHQPTAMGSGYLLTACHLAQGHCRIPGAESQVADGPCMLNCYLCVLMLRRKSQCMREHGSELREPWCILI